MAENDPRLQWIRDRVSAGFHLSKHPECLDELLRRDDGKEKDKILHYLNDVSNTDSQSVLLFFKTVREKEIEVKLPLGKCLTLERGFFLGFFFCQKTIKHNTISFYSNSI